MFSPRIHCWPTPIISRFGASKNEAVTITVGCTILTDTCALLVLAVISGSTAGELDLAFWTRLVISLGVYVSVVVYSVPRLYSAKFRKK